MAAHVTSPVQFRYFHGTGGGIEGGVVRPRTKGTGRSMDELAFASSRVRDAMGFAAMVSRDQGRLFGSVYEVNPRNPRPSPLGDPKHVTSVEGMDVIKHTGFVHYDDEADEAKWL